MNAGHAELAEKRFQQGTVNTNFLGGLKPKAVSPKVLNRALLVAALWEQNRSMQVHKVFEDREFSPPRPAINPFNPWLTG